MELPKIKNEDLPEELRKILGDSDAEFESIVDPADIIDIEIDEDQYNQERLEVARKLIESREKLNDLKRQERHNNV
jgi:hypothetical protein